MPGVTIQIEGTTDGTSTTFEGNYALKANDKNDVLKFSYINRVVESFDSKTTLDPETKTVCSSLSNKFKYFLYTVTFPFPLVSGVNNT